MTKPLTIENVLPRIAEYETARQLVRGLEKRRSDLIHSCTGVKEYGNQYVRSCLDKAYKEWLDSDKGDWGEPELNYEEFLDNGDDYCDTCKEAYKLKVSELAPARKRFGKAKRNISSLGKLAIEQSEADSDE